MSKKKNINSVFNVDITIGWDTYVFTEDVKYRIEQALIKALYDNRYPRVDVTRVVRVEVDEDAC
jgi:hypothetical protein